ncbi:hypothetical protein ACFQO1_02110 [Jejudonia soesokkakensis]|uniref:Replication initiation protein n=1 Tax=Jejudonia soesokkakensis TaxID=1323432 RepID=A0ABW2MRE2_9FLAO
MVDKIKLILDNIELSNEAFGKFKFFSTAKNDKRIKVFKRFIKNDSRLNIEYKEYKISLTLLSNEKLSNNKLIIEGNFRKWYFGTDNISDLNKKKFCNVVSQVAKKIGIEQNVLWNARVTKLETGVTVKLKEKHRGIVNCIFSYKNFRKNTYDNSGVEFKGENYDVIFYDMLRRMFNRKHKLERQYKKLTKSNFFFRYEIQVHKVSGVDMFKEKANTLLKIKNNWKYLGQNLITTLDNVKFVDVISPSQFMELKGATKKPMTDYLTYKGIESIGMENLRQLINQMKPKSRPDYRRDFIELYEKQLSEDKEDYESIFKEFIQNRVKELI